MVNNKDNDTDDNDDDDDDDDDDNNGWFYKPTEYIQNFSDSLKDMISEEQQEEMRQQLQDGIKEEEIADEESSVIACEDGNVRHVLNPLLVEYEQAESKETPQSKAKATFNVPGVGRRYKSTVVAELRSNPEFSTDRLKRMKDATVASRTQNVNAHTNNDDGLFDDCAFHCPTNPNIFVIGRTQRMRKKGKRGYVEYVRPVDLDEKPPSLEFIITQYSSTTDQENPRVFQYNPHSVATLPATSVICKISLEIDDNSDDCRLREEDLNAVLEFIRLAERRPTASGTSSSTVLASSDRNMEDDGRRIDLVTSSRGRQRRQVSYLF